MFVGGTNVQVEKTLGIGVDQQRWRRRVCTFAAHGARGIWQRAYPYVGSETWRHREAIYPLKAIRHGMIPLVLASWPTNPVGRRRQLLLITVSAYTATPYLPTNSLEVKADDGRCCGRQVPVACPVASHRRGAYGHSRTARYTGSPAYRRADLLRPPCLDDAED